MIDKNMVKNIKNNDTNSMDVMQSTFESQNNLIDSIINKMYNYDLYGRYKDASYNEENPHEYTSSKLSTLLQKNINTQNEMLNSLSKDGNRLGQTYDYNASIYKNQLDTNLQIAEEKDVVQNRYNSTTETIEKNNKQHEIYQYHYYKYRAQMKILYHFILLMVVIIIVTYLNRNFNFILNNALYVLILGILCAVFFIYLIRQLYDIYLRSKFVFDEYDYPSPSSNRATSDADDSDGDLDDDSSDDENCEAQWESVDDK